MISSALNFRAEVGFASFDKELRAITREAEKGPRECDLLLQVRLLSGQSGWFYVRPV